MQQDFDFLHARTFEENIFNTEQQQIIKKNMRLVSLSPFAWLIHLFKNFGLSPPHIYSSIHSYIYTIHIQNLNFIWKKKLTQQQKLIPYLLNCIHWLLISIVVHSILTIHSCTSTQIPTWILSLYMYKRGRM